MLNHLPTPEEFTIAKSRHASAKRELLETATDIFASEGADPVAFGSAARENPDFYSDLDLWVVCPDDRLEETIQRRDELYRQFGKVLLCWERPRFAPVGGKHSVLMYESDVMPIEMDVFLVSENNHNSMYSDITTPNTGEPRIYPWETGEDNPSYEAGLDYLLCVSYWATKYTTRGEGDKIEWFAARYGDIQKATPGLAPFSADDLLSDEPAQVIERYIDHIARTVRAPEFKERISGMHRAARMGQMAVMHSPVVLRESGLAVVEKQSLK